MSQHVTRALIIAEPWITLILSGVKTWEMRSKATHIRGRIGLIRKGSKAVVGIAQIVDCLPPVSSLERLAEMEPFHRIPPDHQADAFRRNWRRPWVLADVRTLPRPVPYVHKPGQQDWVTLDPLVVGLSLTNDQVPRCK